MRQRRRSERAQGEHALGLIEQSTFSEFKRLPTGRDILAVMLYRVKRIKDSVPTSARYVINEAFAIFMAARIPTKDKSNASRDVVNLYTQWDKLRKFANRTCGPHLIKIRDFKNSLDCYFPLHHHEWEKIIKNKEDKTFLLQQMQPGRKGYISVPDRKLWAKEQQQAARNAKAEQYRKRVNSELSATSSVASYHESDDSEEENGEEEPSEEFKIRDRKNTPKLKPIFTPLLAASLDWAKISDRKAVGVVGASLISSGQNLKDFSLSRTTVQRSRSSLRPKIVDRIKLEMDKETPLLLHFDGKLLPSLSGHEKDDRVAVHVSAGEVEQLLGVPKVAAGTGKLEAEAAHNLVMEWGLGTQIRGAVFDTTAVNTGIWNGSLVFLQRLLNIALLFFACRHHVAELVLKAAYEFCMGQMKCSEVSVFNTFRKKWPNINKESFQTGLSDPYVKKLIMSDADDTILFCKAQLQEQQSRGDYKNLLILVIIFLGGVPPGGIRFFAPPATNDARWMNRAIYALLMFMFRKEFPLNSQEQTKNLRDLCVFIVIVYVRYWFTCTVAAMAPLNDLNFLKCVSVCDRRKISNVLRVAEEKFVNHLWYLGEELVCLALFDSRVSLEEKRKMVESLKSRDSNEKNLKKVDKIGSVEHGLSLSEFVSKKSIFLFDALKLPKDFLSCDPVDWNTQESYKQAKRFVDSLKVVNDIAERGIGLITEFNNILTYDETQKQYLLQIVARFRKLFPHQSKSELEKMSLTLV